MKIQKQNPLLLAFGCFLVLFALSLSACSQGDTDGGAAGDETFDDAPFVGDRAGTIEVVPVEDGLEVASIGGFHVYVKDASGRGVPNVTVSCDSEDGVAIIEPTSGRETTDSDGHISGRIGCELPGSFLFGCRLPVGGNRRKFVTILCSGAIPTGFSGFPGAAGGGLGGGVSVPDGGGGAVGGGGTEGVRITAIKASDLGDPGASTTSIDVVQDPDCDDTSDDDADIPEPFFDTTFSVTVVNQSNSTIRFNEMAYSVDNASGSGTSSFNSNTISLIGEAVSLDANGGTDTFNVLAFDVVGGGKRFFGASSNISSALGFRNITVRLTGANDLGESVTVTGRTALSFDDFDNCS